MFVVDRGSGPVLLLVHGFPLDHSMWRPQIDEFSRDFRVLAPDLPGFGRSPAELGYVTMERFADDLAELLDARGVDEPVHLCGLSMGGYIAWQFWRKHAERLRSLILCDTRAAADTPEAREGRLKMAAHVLEYGAAAVSEMMLPKMFAPATLREQPDVVAAIRQTIVDTDRESIAAAQHGMATRPDMRECLPQVTLPTLVVVGAEDQLTPPAEMRALADALPNAQFLEVAGAGHMAPLERPEIVNASLRKFLSGA